MPKIGMIKYEPTVRGRNLYLLDVNLQRALEWYLGPDVARFESRLTEFGVWAGGPADIEAEYTDRFAHPWLEAYDRDGALANRIVQNPSWEQTSREVYELGIVGLNYGDDRAPFTVTFAMGYMLSQSNVSLHCPVTMTGAVAYVLDRFAPADLRTRMLRRITRMDGQALTGGTWATEQHGGSDVGASTTVAHRDGEVFRLNGLKWFTSNANSGLALATARPEGAPEGTRGLGLYLVPTHLENGEPNPMRIRRLKEKLGTVGVPTGEIDLTGTVAYEVAPPPDGFKLMMEALEFSRLHNAMASVGLQRRAFLEAMTFAGSRKAFGHTITEYPMVQDEILRILVPQEAGLALSLEAAKAFDSANHLPIDNVEQRPWMRLVTALAKYQTAEDAVAAASRTIEIIGGNGYTYDFITPRLLRDAQVTTVWEGPANVQALEVLRLLGNRYPGFADFVTRVENIIADANTRDGDIVDIVRLALDDCRTAVEYVLADPGEAKRHARRLMSLLADTLSPSLLLEEASRAHGKGDARKAVVARLYAAQRFATAPRRGIGPGGDLGHRHFQALVGYGPVSPAEAA